MNEILTKITSLTCKSIDELENIEISDSSKIVCYKGMLNDLLTAVTQHLVEANENSTPIESIKTDKSMLTYPMYGRVNPKIAKIFKMKLIDEDLTYQQWLINEIDEYLKK